MSAFHFQRLTKSNISEVITGIHFQYFAQLRDSFIVPARIIVVGTHIGIDDERERIQLGGSVSLGDGVIEAVQRDEADVAVLLVPSRVIWVQFNRVLKFPDRLSEIEIVKQQRDRQTGMRFGQ